MFQRGVVETLWSQVNCAVRAEKGIIQFSLGGPERCPRGGHSLFSSQYWRSKNVASGWP